MARQLTMKTILTKISKNLIISRFDRMSVVPHRVLSERSYVHLK